MLVSQPTGNRGLVVLNLDGSFTYTPAPNVFGTSFFRYKANDGTDSNFGTGDSNTVTVFITVRFVNDAGPTAVDDNYGVDEDNVLTVDAATGVLANDFDIDGDTLSATLVSGPANGVLQFASDGSFTYTHPDNFFGTDSFTYQANNGTVLSNEATVTITVGPVNDGPVAVNDSYQVNENTLLVIDAAQGVLANDSDPEMDSLTAVAVDSPSNGVVNLAADGSFTYTPNLDFFGEDTFTYMANDGSLDSSEAIVTITVNPVNDAPIAVDDSYELNQNGELTVDIASGVLANDTDTDGDSLTAIQVTGPNNGVLSLASDGSLVYTPDGGFVGVDSFTYRANDGVADSDEAATVTITVNELSSHERLDLILAQLEKLSADGVLKRGPFNSLTTTVDGAQAKLDQGQHHPAMGMLGAFIHKVEALVRATVLDQDQGRALIDEAQDVIALEALDAAIMESTLAVNIADPDCGTPGDKLFCEIQEAVDAADSGDKIRVHAGTYQPFVVNKDNLTIREAKENSDPMIDATGVENGIEVNANGVTLKGLEVQNASRHGFLVSGDNNTFRGNTASGNVRDGFFVSSERNTLTGNTASGNGDVGNGRNHPIGNGFSVSGDNNTLRGNTASGNVRDGFFVSSERNTLTGNTASGNGVSREGGSGFHLFLSDNNTLRGNTARDNGVGFSLRRSSDNTLQRNTASGNAGHGFNVTSGQFDSSDNNTLIDNKAIDNAGWGFFIEELLANMFDDNECEGNTLGGSNLPDIC